MVNFSSRKNYFGAVLSLTLSLSILTLSLVFFPQSTLAQETQVQTTLPDSMQVAESDSVKDKVEELELDFIALPIVGYSTEDGLTFGAMVGWQRTDGLLLYFHGFYGTMGRLVLKVNGEIPLEENYISGYGAFRQSLRHTYAPLGGTDILSTALVDRFYVRATMLHQSSTVFEVGPEIEVDWANSKEVKDLDESPATEIPDRFKMGAVALAGARVRYSTTPPLRPMNGFRIEGSFRLGAADGDYMPDPRFDFATDLLLARAQPIFRDLRLYVRGYAGYQSEAPPPVRQHLGGESTLRGQPDQRDFGRRLVTGRSQLHWTITRDLRWPSMFINSILPMLPVRSLEVELVGFYDVGAVNDPDYSGWLRTRMGYGGGMRVVMPPYLVFHADAAYSKDAGYFFYLGAGETL